MKSLLLIMCILMVAYFSFESIRRKDKYFALLCLLASCYGFGKLIQYWHVGPLVLRWYLSDIGFVPFVTLWALFANPRSTRRIALMALVIALLQEITFILLTPYIVKGKFGARGDWVDIVIFVLTYFVTVYLAKKITAPPPKPPRNKAAKAPAKNNSKRRKKKKKKNK